MNPGNLRHNMTDKPATHDPRQHSPQGGHNYGSGPHFGLLREFCDGGYAG